MRLANVGDASSLIRAVLEDTGGGNETMTVLNVSVPSSQKELVAFLARRNRVSQALITRAIIDEWCADKWHELEAE